MNIYYHFRAKLEKGPRDLTRTGSKTAKQFWSIPRYTVAMLRVDDWELRIGLTHSHSRVHLEVSSATFILLEITWE